MTVAGEPEILRQCRDVFALRDEVERPCQAQPKVIAIQRQALDLLTNGAGRAFDVSREPLAVREKYDTRSFQCGKKVFELDEIHDAKAWLVGLDDDD